LIWEFDPLSLIEHVFSALCAHPTGLCSIIQAENLVVTVEVEALRRAGRMRVLQAMVMVTQVGNLTKPRLDLVDAKFGLIEKLEI
jgi:hypothetical protein